MNRGNRAPIVFILLSLALFAWEAAATPPEGTAPDTARGAWMAGNWGVRVVLPAGEIPELYAFDPEQLVSQIARIQSIRWVMINLTQGAYGGRYTAPNEILERQVDAQMAPQRDLFGETARLLKKVGLRVLVYFASEGPGAENLHRRPERSPARARLARLAAPVRDAWQRYIKKQGLSNDEAVARVCIEYYSRKYGSLIDGWWFDHGHWGNAERYLQAARAGNAAAVVAWNEKHRYMMVASGHAAGRVKLWGLRRSSPAEDYTAGHITPTIHLPPWSMENDAIIRQIEQWNQKRSAPADTLVAHLFLPLQATWRGGKARFPDRLAMEWTRRVIRAGGAITWAVALRAPEYAHAELAAKQFGQLLAIDASLLAAGMPPR